MINTFVFTDLESTGLRMFGNRVRATEISLISVTRKDILNCNIEECIPRIINKISFVCNPRAMIPDDVVCLTGLSNEKLEDQSPFDQNKADLIKLFLQNCVPPICLIAHNGFNFDFPLLKKELATFTDTVAPDVLCADSLPAFKHLNREQNANEIGFSPIIDRTDVMLFDEVSRIEEYISSQESNEVTPIAQLMNEPCCPSNGGKAMATTTTTPPPLLTLSKNMDNLGNAKRKLFADNDRGEETIKTKLAVNYSLKHVYLSLFHRSISNAHRAESDAIALLQCCVKMGVPMLEYFDSQAKKFEDIAPMR